MAMAKPMGPVILESDTSSSSPSQPQQRQSSTPSRSSSPIHPPYSPITPTLAAARLAAGTTSSSPASTSQVHTPNPPPPSQQQPLPQPPSRIYTHTQAPQTFIPAPLPPPETISLDTNPDALALRSALSILQLQRNKATADVQTLHQIKERALADPHTFADAITSGKIKTTPDSLFSTDRRPSSSSSSSSSASDDNEQVPPKMTPVPDSNGDTPMADSPSNSQPQKQKKQWPQLPRPQTVIRTPPINWAQYGIVGDSLDRLHQDQLARPMEGLPARIGADGVAVPTEGPGKRNDGLGVAAPYVPGRDRIEKGKKGGRK